MAILLVVDLQREFVKDDEGLKVYNRCIKYINTCRYEYTDIYAAVYKNDSLQNMFMLTRWEDMQKIQKLDFKPTAMFKHAGYSAVNKMKLNPNTHIDVIGFDTDACVLSHCFDLFNRDVPFKVLVDGVWSSGGESMHKAGLACLKRQFNKAIDEHTKLDELSLAQNKVSKVIK